MQRLFSTFPNSWPGLGLLLLRVATGAEFAVKYAGCLAGWRDFGLGMWLVTLLATASGLCLLIGFLTPLAGTMVGLGSVALALSWLPVVSSNLAHGSLWAVHMAATAVAVVFLGPGWLSLDAYFYGRREIMIPGGRG
ncbi:MAG: hypothetical protein JST79_04100 [Acidobacteria bacterium]|nr:hypothetical protein [Acidobacteriota bacterium]